MHTLVNEYINRMQMWTDVRLMPSRFRDSVSLQQGTSTQTQCAWGCTGDSFVFSLLAFSAPEPSDLVSIFPYCFSSFSWAQPHHSFCSDSLPLTSGDLNLASLVGYTMFFSASLKNTGLSTVPLYPSILSCLAEVCSGKD